MYNFFNFFDGILLIKYTKILNRFMNVSFTTLVYKQSSRKRTLLFIYELSKNFDDIFLFHGHKR